MRLEAAPGTILARGFDWEEVRFPHRRIGEVATLRYGKALVARNRRPGPVPMFGTNGQCGWHDAPLSSGPGVILGRKGQGHLGVKWCETDFWVIDTAYYAELNRSEVDLRWFYYITKYVGLDHLKTGEKPGLSRDIFGRQLFPFPSLDEQRAIAAVLGAVDDKIEANRALNETLEATCQALFRSWFVDFDPVVAKSEGRRPVHLTDDVAALFPDRLEGSPMGPVPAGWTPQPLADCFEVNPTRRLSRGEVAPYLDMKNMPTHAALPDVWGERAFGSGLRFMNGDTLLARITPCLENGKTAFVRFLADGQIGWGSTEYIVLRSKPPLPLEYAYFLARTDDFRGHSIANMTGSSGRQRVPTSCYDKYLVPTPPEKVAKLFGDVAGPALNQMQANILESRTLASLRDALLPRLLSGELLVGSAEELVEEAV